MERNKILIVGHGNVGRNLERELAALQPDVYDIKYAGNKRKHEYYDAIFICVDTPQTADTVCDISGVEAVIREWRNMLMCDGVIVIKSTVPPGTTESMQYKYNVPIVFCPEYYGTTQHANNFNFDFTILGGDERAAEILQSILQRCYDARHKFVYADAKTAELAKYMENCWLATKVTFCCEFFSISNQCGVRYNKLRELFLLDPRVNPSHTFVNPDKPYWDSHCLNKDVAVIAHNYVAPFIQAVIQVNDMQK